MCSQVALIRSQEIETYIIFVLLALYSISISHETKMPQNCQMFFSSSLHIIVVKLFREGKHENEKTFNFHLRISISVTGECVYER